MGTCAVTSTGGWQTWVTQSCSVSGATGIHNVYLVFTGGSGYLFNVDWWDFNCTTVAGSAGGAGRFGGDGRRRARGIELDGRQQRHQLRRDTCHDQRRALHHHRQRSGDELLRRRNVGGATVIGGTTYYYVVSA